MEVTYHPLSIPVDEMILSEIGRPSSRFLEVDLGPWALYLPKILESRNPAK